MPSPFLSMTALELAAHLRDGAVSAEETLAFYAERTERLNPSLQAFVSTFPRWARATARRRDRHRAQPTGPFHGVPTGVKDVHFARGTFSRMGSRAFRWLVSPIDDLTVTAMRRAGFVLLGKLSTSELALMPVVEPDIHPPTRNPWNLEHSAGGSSGGSAAAVAGGLLPIALGSDGGGSIRIPAAFCNLVGFKSSRGAVPNPFKRFDRHEMSAIGSLARSVEDSAAFLDALCGRDPAVPGSLLQASRQRPKRLRVMLITEAPLGTTHPELLAAVLRVRDGLRSLGHHVEEKATLKVTLDEFLPIYQRFAANSPVLREASLQPVTRWLRQEGRKYTQDEAQRRVESIAARIRDWFSDADILLSPTTPCPAPRVSQFQALPPEEAFRAAAPIGSFTVAFNLTGDPAVSLPAGFTSAGLPMGVQLGAHAGQDALLFALAHELEAEAVCTSPRVPSPLTV